MPNTLTALAPSRAPHCLPSSMRPQDPTRPGCVWAREGGPSALRLCCLLAAPNKPGRPGPAGAGRRMAEAGRVPSNSGVDGVSLHTKPGEGGGAGLEKVPGAWHVASSSTLLRAGQGRWAAWPWPHPGHLRSPLRTHFYRTCGCGGARRCAGRGPQTRNPTSSVSLCPLCPQRLTPLGSSLGSARGRDGREVGRVEARQSLLSGSLRGGCRRAEGSGSCEASSRLLWH